MTENKTGTREWSDHSCNIGVGCKNDCIYCYAAANALRFGNIKNRDEWCKERIAGGYSKPVKKLDGVIMFPTTHDITEFYQPYAEQKLFELLNVGNNVLVVSKPDFEIMQRVLSQFMEYKKQLEIRYTIGTTYDDMSRYFEPGASLPEERFRALQWAYSQGFKTSVSIEPMLGSVDEAAKVVDAVTPFTVGKIWIGKMNKPHQRIDKKHHNSVFFERLEMAQCDTEIIRLARWYRGNEIIEWKDSIKQVKIVEVKNENRS